MRCTTARPSCLCAPRTPLTRGSGLQEDRPRRLAWESGEGDGGLTAGAVSLQDSMVPPPVRSKMLTFSPDIHALKCEILSRYGALDTAEAMAARLL